MNAICGENERGYLQVLKVTHHSNNHRSGGSVSNLKSHNRAFFEDRYHAKGVCHGLLSLTKVAIGGRDSIFFGDQPRRTHKATEMARGQKYWVPQKNSTGERKHEDPKIARGSC